MVAWDLAPDVVKKAAHGPAAWVSGQFAHQAAEFADVIVGSYADLVRFGLPDLTGKAVLTNAVSEERLAALAAKGVSLVIDATPEPFDVMVVTAMFEAMAAATITDGHELTTDDLVTFLEAAELEPRLLWPNGFNRRSRFAFVIHPLSTEYFKKQPALGQLAELPGMGRVVEKSAAYMPPFVYSRVSGIVSPDGSEAEGWLITVGGTPKEMLAHPPEFTYSRLLEAADLAKQLGAQVMGLGAFTKVVGDAGVTVSKRATIPITTGNSYSASGALWAAHEAIRRLGIAQVDDEGRLRGKAMVVGGSRPTRCGWSPPRPPSSSPSRPRSRPRTRAPPSTSRPPRATRSARWTSSSPPPRPPARRSSTSWPSSPAASSPTSPARST